MVDHNSRVRAGDRLAALNSAIFEIQVKEAEAALAVALAQLTRICPSPSMITSAAQASLAARITRTILS
jgi:multidrug resistance efflux pump